MPRQRRGLGAALPLPAERHPHRRHHPRHPHRGRRSTQRHPIVAVDPHVGGSQRCPRSTRRTSRAPATATEHLIALGHRRIGFLAGRPDLESARRREAGYRAALESGRHRLRPRPRSTSAASPRRPPTRRPARCSRSPTAPTAIFAANDLSAIQDHAHRPPSSGSRCPTTSRWSGSTTSPSRRSPIRRSPRSTSRSRSSGHEAVRILIDLIDATRPTRRQRRSTSRCRPSSSSGVVRAAGVA